MVNLLVGFLVGSIGGILTLLVLQFCGLRGLEDLVPGAVVGGVVVTFLFWNLVLAE